MYRYMIARMVTLDKRCGYGRQRERMCNGYSHARARVGRGQTTVKSNRSRVNIGSSPTGQEQGRSGNIFRSSDPGKGYCRDHMRQLILEAPRGHFAQEWTACDGIAGDTIPPEPTAHSAREVMETGLAGAVGVCFVVWDHDSFDRTNIDDTSRIDIGFAIFSTLVGGSSKER